MVVPAGHMVLYHPKEMQKYVYYGSDQTEVFWVHFTGSEVKKILKEYHIPLSGHVFYTWKFSGISEGIPENDQGAAAVRT